MKDFLTPLFSIAETLLIVLFMVSCAGTAAQTATGSLFYAVTLIAPFIIVTIRLFRKQTSFKKRVQVGRLVTYLAALLVIAPVLLATVIFSWLGINPFRIHPKILSIYLDHPINFITHRPYLIYWWLGSSWITIHLIDWIFYRYDLLCKKRYYYHIVYSTVFIGLIKVGVLLLSVPLMDSILLPNGLAQATYSEIQLVIGYIILPLIGSSLLQPILFAPLLKSVYESQSHDWHTESAPSIWKNAMIAACTASFTTTMIVILLAGTQGNYGPLLGQALLFLALPEAVLIYIFSVFYYRKKLPRKQSVPTKG